MQIKKSINVHRIYASIFYICLNTNNHKNNIKIVQIPTIFQSLKPYNDFINIDFEHYNNQDSNIEVDIEILIHVRKNQRGVFGHADFIYKDNVYSYDDLVLFYRVKTLMKAQKRTDKRC